MILLFYRRTKIMNNYYKNIDLEYKKLSSKYIQIHGCIYIYIKHIKIKRRKRTKSKNKQKNKQNTNKNMSDLKEDEGSVSIL